MLFLVPVPHGPHGLVPAVESDAQDLLAVVQRESPGNKLLDPDDENN